MAEQIISKQCSKCKEIKPLSEFHKKAASRDGFRSECRTCESAAQKYYRQSEKGKTAQKRRAKSEKFKIQQKRYRQSEKGKAMQKRYRRSEKGKTNLKRSRKNYMKTEKGKAVQKLYHIRHSNQKKAKHAVQNAIRRGRLPRAVSLLCHYCPAQAKEYHHHKGYEPEHWLDVVPVCKKCHVLQQLIKNSSTR